MASLSSRTLRIRQVAEKTGLSPSTIWRLSAEGGFPKPIKLSKNCTAVIEQEIDDLLDTRSAERVHHSLGSKAQTPA